MSMTKKHFEALALQLAYSYDTEDERVKAVDVLSDFCTEQNPRFNRKLFADHVEKIVREREAAIKATLENA